MDDLFQRALHLSVELEEPICQNIRFVFVTSFMPNATLTHLNIAKTEPKPFSLGFVDFIAVSQKPCVLNKTLAVKGAQRRK